MSDIHIFTSLIVPVTTNGPSLAALQWSEDGQAFIVTRGAIYILTPSNGIKFDPSSVITASVQSTNKNVKGQPLSWYRTMIELEKTPAHHWPFECQDWGTVSLGVLDMSWNSITLSPTNLSRESCCVLVALNTNLEVSLWAPSKNYLTGEWSKIQDVTQVIKDSETAPSSTVQKTLNAQVLCISWSPQVKFGEGSHYVDGSLLALGNRAGRVVFMRSSSTDVGQAVQLVASIDVADDWVHQLAWSSWRKVTSNHFQASLACGVPDGNIVIVSVTLILDGAPEPLSASRFEFKILDKGKSCCPSDGSVITALKWIEPMQHAPILAYAKPGVIHLQNFPSELPHGWTGSRTLALELQPVSSSSTPFTAVSGFIYYQQHDALLVSLFDGSFHMINGISTSPHMKALEATLSSEELTRQVRAVFAISEGRASFADSNRTSGILDFDGAGSIGWLHEKTRPDDFSYKHDAKHASIFVVTRLWMDESFVFKHLAKQLARNTNFDTPPVHVLRGAFLHLRDSTFLEIHQQRLVELLVQSHSIDETHLDPLLRAPAGLNDSGGPMLKTNFRHYLATSFFRTRDVHSLRLKLAVANVCSSVRRTAAAPFSSLADELASGILCIQLQAVIRQISRVVDQLDDNDRGFVHRWVTQSIAQGSLNLQQEAAALASRVGVPGDSPLDSPDLQEHCPACHAPISLGNSSSATCPNGHTWARCSVTSYVLATPFVRTCVGCCRKALLPPSQRAPASGNGDLALLSPVSSSWLVREILEAARWCTLCGNRFVRVF